jgi:hypothetical protein
MIQWLRILIFVSPSICFVVWFFALSWNNPTLTDMQLWQMVIGQSWKFLVGIIVLQVAGVVLMNLEKPEGE